MNYQFTQEPMLDEEMAILTSNDGANEILLDYQKLQHTLYFFSKEQIPSIINRYVTLTDEENKFFLKNVFELSPFSKKLIIALLDEHKENGIMQDKILESFLILEQSYQTHRSAVERAVRVNSNEYNKYIIKINKNIEELDKIKDATKENLEELRRVGSKEKTLQQQVEVLKTELAQQEKNYTKEVLEQQKLEIEQKLRAIAENKKSYDKNAEYLIDLVEQIDVKSTTDSNNNKIVQELNKLVKKLPKSEE